MTAIRQLTEDWESLLGRSTVFHNPEQFSALHSDKAILITGAGGSIGSALAQRIAIANPRALILLDASEQSLYQIDCSLARQNKSVPRTAILGSVSDRKLLEDIFRKHRPDLIYHAAAHKHVPLMEANPFAAIRNNALGTWCLAQAAAEHRVPRLLMISTDKAVNPVSIMGTSKRIAELALQVSSCTQTEMNSIRMGNILGSQGSVVPRFLDQISHGDPVTVTHPDAERFFFTIDETVSLIGEAANCEQRGHLVVPKTNRSIKILTLANYLIRKHGAAPADKTSIVFTGLRVGEKLQESFVASDEMLAESISDNLSRVQSDSSPVEVFAYAMEELDRTARMRDLTGMLQMVQCLVPHYSPSSFLIFPNATPLVDLHG
jgi:FlaA1/EpsC-like NDP-sugar epimerase